MSKELDKFFKDKLADHAMAPSPQAWTSIQAGLSKKNSRPIVLRIAAAVVLLSTLAVAITLLTSRNTITPSNKLASHETAVEKVQPSQGKRQQLPAVGVPKVNHQARVRTIQKTRRSIPEIKQEAHTETQPSDYALLKQAEIRNEIIQPVEIQEPAEKAVVIEYHLATVEPSSAAQSAALTETKEKSGFRKVIDFAIDAKNSSPLGDLREAKDGLFAFNFKKDKQKNVK